MEIVLATHNLHKVREFRDMFKSLPHIDVLSLLNFPNYKLPEETGSTFEENAILKAEHAAKALGKWVLADDSGLVIPSIAGKPGVISKRYAGNEATDVDNRKKLMSDMKHLKGLERSGYFECVLALSSPDGLKKAVRGVCEGTVLDEERGNHGFGYDSLFIKHDYDKTFAELDETTKNRISHRRKAFERLIAILESLK